MPNPLETAWNEHLASTQGADGGETTNSGVTAKDRAQEYWNGGDIFGDWFGHQDTFAHNEALAAYQREKEASKEAFEREANFNASAARENREWEKMMSDTAFQRKVADYKAAGFSPLAALEGAVGATSPSGTAATATGHKASANPASQGGNNLGSVFGSLVAAVALIATKGMSAASKAAASSGKAIAEAYKAGVTKRVMSRLEDPDFLKKMYAYNEKYLHR